MPENFTHGYALLIGVGCTQAPGWSLPVTVKDARAMHVLLTDPARCAYPAQAVRLLHDAGATRAAILDGLAWLSGRALTDPQATAVVYVSGHGLEHTTGHYVLVPHDFDPDDAVGSGLAAAGFTAALRAVRARRLLVIVDTCHAAGMTLGAKSKGDGESPSVPPDFTPAPLPKGYVDTLAEGEGRAVFTASRGAQKSWVRPDGVLSVFTYHMLEALQGAGNRPGDTRVKVSNLMRHLGEAVPQSARRIGVQQTPFFKFETEDFPVALLRGGKGLPAGGWPAAREEATDAIARVINQVTVDGGSVAAVGDQARAANGGGVAAGDVGGSIATGDHAIAANGPVTVHQDESTHIGIQAGHIDAQNVVNGPQTVHYWGTEPQPSADLKDAYLNYVFETVGKLSLAGVDRKAASDAEARLDLGAVYTALLTLTPEDGERGMQRPRAEAVSARDRRDLTSALAQLDRHDRLVLLGDPGSGKSTFVNFVALCLAGERLGKANVNVARLTAPLPQEEKEKDEETAPQPWSHGALLPVPVVLRDFAARGLPPEGEAATASHLWDFITAELENAALGDYAPHLHRALQETGGLLLLDGLDEVPKAARRRTQIKQAVEAFAAAFPQCRILVTSRTYAYQQQAWRLMGFAEAVLAPFGEAQMRHFVDRWYAHIAALRRLHADEAQGRAALLKRAIFGSDRLRALAERPLLLTLMASLHAWRGGSLPERREELYAETVDLLLDWWEQPKAVRDAEGQYVILQPSLGEWLRVDRERVRALLNALAYQAHAEQPDLVGTADVPGDALVSGLLRLSQNPDVKLMRLVEYLSQRAGLLLPRGEGVYTFPHRTFQEYLAACHLTDHEYPERVAELARRDPNRWREVALLAGAKAAGGTASAIWSLVDALCYCDLSSGEPQPEPDAWGALLAGQALVESGGLAQVSPRNQPKVERVQAHLVRVLEAGRLPAVERAAAGRVLAKLGDPRPGVGVVQVVSNVTLPDIVWCEVPAGPFTMGSEGDPQAYDDEKPQHVRDVPAYWISRYPITNAQFMTFVKAGGYADPAYWTEAARAEVWKDGKVKGVVDDEPRVGSYDFGESFSLLNHPVVGVTWYEAVAFCRWLTEQMRKAVVPLRVWREGRVVTLDLRCVEVTLPSEIQWEKAARGPVLSEVEGPARIYPWGDEPDPERANYSDTGIGTTSAVGAFPDGVSPYGVLDMSGNVWEWTRSLSGDYPYVTGAGREALDADGLRVVRGGSFDLNERFVRCAFRYWYPPFNVYGNLGVRVALVSPSFSEL